MKKFFVCASFFLSLNIYAQKFEGLALTPPMGWNSWNKFQCNVDKNMIRQQADAMVSTGMKDAGYMYINIDDCWHGERDRLGFIHPDPKRFPSGIKALADYVHSKGIKIGIYSDAGWKTCGGRPGSRGYEFQKIWVIQKVVLEQLFLRMI
jgi:alpha-galactosidase